MKRSFLLALVVFLVMSSGCIQGLPGATPTTTTQPKVYVTPCRVLDNDTLLRVASKTLDSSPIASEAVKYYADDFKIPGANIPSTYKFNCHWGSKIGEDIDYLYCDGRYKAPELDEFGVIQRYIWKEFTLGFSVQTQQLGTYVDSAGVTHQDENVYYLRIKELKTTCYVA